MGIAPAAAGLAFGALGGGAAAGGGAGDAVGSGMAYLGPGSAGAGAAGEGVSTLGQLQAMYAGLPDGGRALTGAGMGGIRGGSSGGWGGRAARGRHGCAVTGGVWRAGGEWALSGLGAPSWLSGFGGKLAGVGTGLGIGSPLGGAAGAGESGLRGAFRGSRLKCGGYVPKRLPDRAPECSSRLRPAAGEELAGPELCPDSGREGPSGGSEDDQGQPRRLRRRLGAGMKKPLAGLLTCRPASALACGAAAPASGAARRRPGLTPAS